MRRLSTAELIGRLRGHLLSDDYLGQVLPLCRRTRPETRARASSVNATRQLRASHARWNPPTSGSADGALPDEAVAPVQTSRAVSPPNATTATFISLGPGAHLRCVGKGRKHRATPLRRDAVVALKAWVRTQSGAPGDPLFPSLRGHPLSRDAVERLVMRYAAAAAERCPSLQGKRVTPHVLRHGTAMDLLRHGVDRSVIALWLGHESVETTQMYLEATLAMKEQALAKTTPPQGTLGRYQPGDELLNFLNSL